jgi:hypothetical protein
MDENYLAILNLGFEIGQRISPMPGYPCGVLRFLIQVPHDKRDTMPILKMDYNWDVRYLQDLTPEVWAHELATFWYKARHQLEQELAANKPPKRPLPPFTRE